MHHRRASPGKGKRMWQEWKWVQKYETSLRQGVSGWAWPFSVLIAGLELDIVIHVLIWLSQLTLPPGLTIPPLF
ncbi:hypothetical protein DLNHIDIE_00782 [Acidithiobacillus thiooxidans ATCC 19377]|uniref:Uncharacterized protein n=1 Tax=Acidithiobacillus thiooxidans ATCC 19377 TaxID=637390 RepID=A0A543Q3M8_ACITH|nr:hypothetical protein DLNHIDIE_00782 [Acidithiobacillus thiooxidans ATCC 19377]